jgi:curved DNA-binding protein CbpA
MAKRSLYEIMMLHPTATTDVVNAVYRTLAKQYHPDHAGAAGVEKMAQLNEAYAILKDEAKRARYDEILEAEAQTRSAAVPRSRTAATSHDLVAAAAGTEYSRQSMPGATNLKFEAGTWSVRPPTEPTPPPTTFGDAGPPPSYLPARGTVISFGRYRGWTVSQVAAYDRNYVEWLSRTMAGRTYRAELSAALGQAAV